MIRFPFNPRRSSAPPNGLSSNHSLVTKKSSVQGVVEQIEIDKAINNKNDDGDEEEEEEEDYEDLPDEYDNDAVDEPDTPVSSTAAQILSWSPSNVCLSPTSSSSSIALPPVPTPVIIRHHEKTLHIAHIDLQNAAHTSPQISSALDPSSPLFAFSDA
jgi:hypothetical protein